VSVSALQMLQDAAAEMILRQTADSFLEFDVDKSRQLPHFALPALIQQIYRKHFKSTRALGVVQMEVSSFLSNYDPEATSIGFRELCQIYVVKATPFKYANVLPHAKHSTESVRFRFGITKEVLVSLNVLLDDASDILCKQAIGKLA